MTSELAGRVALVTGANQGIGAAAAIALARMGADVAISFCQTTEDGDEYPAAFAQARSRDGSDVVAAIEALGRRAVRIGTRRDSRSARPRGAASSA